MVQDAPHCEGKKLAVALSSARIDKTVVPKSAVFAMMFRCYNAILGCHAGSPFLLILVTANGGLIATSGSQMREKHQNLNSAMVDGDFASWNLGNLKSIDVEQAGIAKTMLEPPLHYLHGHYALWTGL